MRGYVCLILLLLLFVCEMKLRCILQQSSIARPLLQVSAADISCLSFATMLSVHKHTHTHRSAGSVKLDAQELEDDKSPSETPHSPHSIGSVSVGGHAPASHSSVEHIRHYARHQLPMHLMVTGSEGGSKSGIGSSVKQNPSMPSKRSRLGEGCSGPASPETQEPSDVSSSMINAGGGQESEDSDDDDEVCVQERVCTQAFLLEGLCAAVLAN